MLGHFVFPTGGSAWSETFVRVLGSLGIEEGATRQALARTAARGGLAKERFGRRVHWTLTPEGLADCRRGALMISMFQPALRDWDGSWLLVLRSVSEDQRDLRHQVRRRLAWAGFGSVVPGVWVSPDRRREPDVEGILAELGLADGAMSFVARFGTLGEDRDMLRAAWDLDDITRRYRAFVRQFSAIQTKTGEGAFVALTRLVHEWRRFPFVDPGLPEELLPENWIGWQAKELFDDRRARWESGALDWFVEVARGA